MYVARCSHSHLLNSYSTHSWLLMLISFLYFPRLSNFRPKRKKRTEREKKHTTLRAICRLQFAKVNTFDFSWMWKPVELRPYMEFFVTYFVFVYRSFVRCNKNFSRLVTKFCARCLCVKELCAVSSYYMARLFDHSVLSMWVPSILILFLILFDRFFCFLFFCSQQLLTVHWVWRLQMRRLLVYCGWRAKRNFAENYSR